MLLRRSGNLESAIHSSDITPQDAFERYGRQRRFVIGGAATLTAGAFAASYLPGLFFPSTTVHAQELPSTPSKYNTTENQTPFAKATHYNNFYEFGTEKIDPAKNAHTLKTRPWTIQVTGMVKKPQTIDIEKILKYRPIESRIYRHRCVEAWSMVIPWEGYSLSEFINLCEPLSQREVRTVHLSRRQKTDAGSTRWLLTGPTAKVCVWTRPLNPLALLTFGCYGQVLPNQNGAPIRVVVPWKYGFKNAKSIVRLHFTDKQPKTTWNEINSQEYGFYSNVNPQVDHPRWTQARERRIDSSAFPKTIPTQMFNGYADQVASLYNGMNLKRYY